MRPLKFYIKCIFNTFPKQIINAFDILLDIEQGFLCSKNEQRG